MPSATSSRPAASRSTASTAGTPARGTTARCRSRSGRCGTRSTNAGCSSASSRSFTTTSAARRRSSSPGPSFGAYHAANLALRRAHLFPVAICQSGVYDVSVVGWGERGDAAYFHNPMDYVAHLGGEHLDWLRGQATIVLTVGRGQWEDTTGALESTQRFAGLLAEKGIRHELDVWGDEWPHDWDSWRAQLAAHLPRFV